MSNKLLVCSPRFNDPVLSLSAARGMRAADRAARTTPLVEAIASERGSLGPI